MSPDDHVVFPLSPIGPKGVWLTVRATNGVGVGDLLTIESTREVVEVQEVRIKVKRGPNPGDIRWKEPMVRRRIDG